MAIKGLTLSSVKRYVLTRDPCRGPNGEEVDGSTVFILKTLDGQQIAAVRDSQYAVDQEVVDAAAAGKENTGKAVQFKVSPYGQSYEAIRIGLQGWENFQDQDGNTITFETEMVNVAGRSVSVVKRELLGRIDAQDAFELMTVLMQMNTVSAAEEKK